MFNVLPVYHMLTYAFKHYTYITKYSLGRTRVNTPFARVFFKWSKFWGLEDCPCSIHNVVYFNLHYLISSKLSFLLPLSPIFFYLTFGNECNGSFIMLPKWFCLCIGKKTTEKFIKKKKKIQSYYLLLANCYLGLRRQILKYVYYVFTYILKTRE